MTELITKIIINREYRRKMLILTREQTEQMKLIKSFPRINHDKEYGLGPTL